MKIVHIITRLIVGGAQENTLLSCEGQHQLGHEVTLITGPPMGPEGSLLQRAQSSGYRVIVLDSMRRAILPGKDYFTYRELVKLIRGLNPDVVHTHSSKAGIIGRWAAARAGVPAVIHTIHGLAFTASVSPLVNGFYKFMERVTAPKTNRIVCVADAMAEQSLAAHIGRREQYVTPPVPRDQARERLGLSPEHVAVGTIARLFHLKGHDDLLDLAPRLCAHWPNLRFLWIGDGLLRDAFERRMSEMNLRDRFVLTGLVPPGRIPELAGAMDILVHPSRREGLARALPQGSLAGKPLVTYDIDGNREALIEGETGWALPPFDKEKLGEKIELLLGDEALRSRMGDAGRKFALRRFDTEVMVDGLEAVYRESVAGKCHK
jgi:glycosyltransferase involved in cell wall biosynthesis